VTSAAAASLSALPRTLSTDDLAAISNFNVVYDTCTAASSSSGQFADEWNKRKQKIISPIQASTSLPLRTVTSCSASHSLTRLRRQPSKLKRCVSQRFCTT
jgi:hypothetical protein